MQPTEEFDWGNESILRPNIARTEDGQILLKCQYCDRIFLLTKEEYQERLDWGRKTGYDPFKKFGCPPPDYCQEI